MRKLFFVLVAVLWVAAGIQAVKSLNREDEEQIVEAFHKTNCMDAVSEVLAEGTFKDYQTHERQKEILQEVAGCLGIESACEVSEKRDGSRYIVELHREAAQAEVSLRIVSVESAESGAVADTSQYMTAQITLYDDLECAAVYKESLERAMQEYSGNLDASLQFQGELQGRLTKGERSALTGQLLENISAKERSSNEEEGVYTVYAYTELAGDYEVIHGEAVNVTVAVTYDETTGRTRLYLATPMMKGDY